MVGILYLKAEGLKINFYIKTKYLFLKLIFLYFNFFLIVILDFNRVKHEKWRLKLCSTVDG